MNNYEIMMNGTVRVGEYAPDFEAETTMGPINLNDYRGKWIVLKPKASVTLGKTYPPNNFDRIIGFMLL